MVHVDGQPRIGVQLAPAHVAPEWPDGTPQQIHLDLWIDDPDAAHDLVMSLGAKVLKEPEDGDAPDTFRVYADPAGHPFCLCWVKPRSTDRELTGLVRETGQDEVQMPAARERGTKLSERSESPADDPFRGPAANQSRTDVGPAVGRVVPRRPGAMGHRPPAASSGARGG